jgi:hypothetical protein
MTKCCEPHEFYFSGLTPWKVHSRGCRMAGLEYFGDAGPAPVVEIKSLEQREMEAERFRHPAKGTRRPRRSCSGFRYVCPNGGCLRCLF